MAFERMILRDGDAAAYYVPRGFYIRLNQDAFDSAFRLKKTHLPLFFHEYAHLLQDRTTLHGAIDFLHFINGIQSTFKHCSSFQKDVPIPLRATLKDGKHAQDDSECWLATTERIRQVISGQEPWPTARNLRLIDKRVAHTSIQSGEFQLATPTVTLTFADSLGTEYEHCLTSWEICEGYAMVIDVLLGGQPPPEIWAYEYHVIRTVCETYYPDMGPWQIAAICQWSLQSPVPAAMFVSLLGSLTATFRTALPEWQQVFDFCRTAVLASGYATHQATAEQELMSTITNQRVDNKDNALSELYNWFATTTIANLNATAAQNDHRFPLGLLNTAITQVLAGQDTKIALLPLFATIPVPMIDQDGLPYFTVGSPQTEVDSVMLLRCMTSIVNHTWAGTDPTIECPLYEKCKLPCRHGKCRSTPWTNMVTGKSPCAFGYAGAAFNITTKSFAPIS